MVISLFFSFSILVLIKRNKEHKEIPPPPTRTTGLVFRHLAERIVYTEQGTLCNFISLLEQHLTKQRRCVMRRTYWRSPLTETIRFSQTN